MAGSLLIVIMPLPVFSQIDPVKVVDQVINKRAASESVSYHINFKMKRFAYLDTLNYTANVELVRKPEDTLFHGLVLIDLDTSGTGMMGRKYFRET
jgi:hypothetical protein